jgi:hypothetical protein
LYNKGNNCPINAQKVTVKDGNCPTEAQKVTVKDDERLEKVTVKDDERLEKVTVKDEERLEKVTVKDEERLEKVTVKGEELPIEGQKVTVKEDGRHSIDMHEDAELAKKSSFNAINVAESAEKLPIEGVKKASSGENYSINSQKNAESAEKLPIEESRMADSEDSYSNNSQKIAESAEKLPIKEPKVSESSKMLPIKISVESYTQAYLDKGYSEPTVLNLNAVYDDIEVNQVFDSAYIMKILECSERTARGLLVKLKEMNVVISVVGKGKGRGRKIFRFKYETEVSEI